MFEHGRELISRKARYWLMGSCALAVAVSPACGSENSSRQVPPPPTAGHAGQGGEDASGGDGAGAETSSSAGVGAMAQGGQAGAAGPGSGGAASGDAGAHAGGVPSTGGADETAGGAGGARACEFVDPTSLQGRWLTTCNGYQTVTNIAPSGALATSSSNGQYASGSLDDEGAIETAGEGGAYVAFTTEGAVTPTSCETLRYAYLGQIPAGTGPQTSYTCDLTRAPDCAATLLAALAGSWDGACGSSTCVTTFTLEGVMTSTCSNGQSSVGSVSEVGEFSDEGGGGNFADYSTTGVIGLQTCDTFIMPYTWQSPPQQGVKHSSQCTYTRQK